MDGDLPELNYDHEGLYVVQLADLLPIDVGPETAEPNLH